MKILVQSLNIGRVGISVVCHTCQKTLMAALPMLKLGTKTFIMFFTKCGQISCQLQVKSIQKLSPHIAQKNGLRQDLSKSMPIRECEF